MPGGGEAGSGVHRAHVCEHDYDDRWGAIGLMQNEPGLRPTWAGVLLAQCEERGGERANF